MSKKILITGSSSGFGKLTINTLLKAGHTVVASMRNTATKNKEVAEELQGQGAKVVDIDVTDEGSVESGVAKAIELMGGIDVVVNNAGIGVLGMQEHFTADDWQKIFNVNVFGVQRMNRAVLPHFRKQQDGLIIYISSLLGRMVFPFYGPYNASKWALEAMAENYRVELSSFGVESSIVEPGGFATDFFGNLLHPSDQSRNAEYGDFMNAPKAAFEGFAQALEANTEQNPQNVADTILALINAEKGQRTFRTPVDKMGMGAAIEPYNEALEKVMQGIYGNFQMSDMLKVKV